VRSEDCLFENADAKLVAEGDSAQGLDVHTVRVGRAERRGRNRFWDNFQGAVIRAVREAGVCVADSSHPKRRDSLEFMGSVCVPSRRWGRITALEISRVLGFQKEVEFGSPETFRRAVPMLDGNDQSLVVQSVPVGVFTYRYVSTEAFEVQGRPQPEELRGLRREVRGTGAPMDRMPQLRSRVP
jgi:hypothetical protein